MKEKKSVLRVLKRILTVILVILLILSVANMIAAKFIYDSLFPRFDSSDFYDAYYPTYEEIMDEYPRKEVGYLCGENRLQGYIYGEGQKGLVVIAPGLSSGARDYIGITMSLVDFGWRVFAFDPTGAYESEGESSVGFAQEIIDLEATLEYIRSDKELKNLELFILGHSRGGYAAACVLNSGFDISGIVTISGVNSAMEITIDSSKKHIGRLAYFGYPALYAYQSFIFGTELTQISAAESLNNSLCPALVIQGEDDDVTPVDTCSIFAHRDEITNPNVEYMLITEDDRSGHTTLMYSSDSAVYREDVTKDFYTLSDKYPEGIPEDVEDDFLETIDDRMTCKVDPGFMEQINSFFEKNLTK